jgi:hypothetical protein
VVTSKHFDTRMAPSQKVNFHIKGHNSCKKKKSRHCDLKRNGTARSNFIFTTENPG